MRTRKYLEVEAGTHNKSVSGYKEEERAFSASTPTAASLWSASPVTVALA